MFFVPYLRISVFCMLSTLLELCRSLHGISTIHCFCAWCSCFCRFWFQLGTTDNLNSESCGEIFGCWKIGKGRKKETEWRWWDSVGSKAESAVLICLFFLISQNFFSKKQVFRCKRTVGTGAIWGRCAKFAFQRKGGQRFEVDFSLVWFYLWCASVVCWLVTWDLVGIFFLDILG